MHMSQFADKLRCQHCGKTHGTKQWPTSGDMVPFYFQKERGNHTLEVSRPHCGKTLYVVWDDNPGPIRELMF